MKRIICTAIVGTVAAFGAACSSGETTRNTTTTNTATANTATTASPAAHTDAPGTAPHGHNSSASADGHGGGAASSDVPANVRAVFPDAQSITTQHKDISASQVTTIERATNTKVADKDHHSYLAFSTTGGARKQVGAATVIKANGKDMVIVYESRSGVPYIKEVRADGVPQTFLDQFKGKGHDDKFQIGRDLKTGGVDDAIARAAADAVRQDAVIMQTLYGGAHSH